MKAGFTRKLGTIVQVVLAAILLTYVIDWAVFHLRMRKGTAISSVQVEQYLTTPLKGNKAEFDYMGTAPESCARSLFPQGGNPACWWLQRHKTDWQ